MLRLLSSPCVSKYPPPPLSPLAEPSVYLPSRKWHQQPSPKEMWQCGLPCTGFSAWVAQSTQKSGVFVPLSTTMRFIQGPESHIYLIYLPTAFYILCDLWWEGGLCASGQGEDTGTAKHHARMDWCAAVYWTCQGSQVLTLIFWKKSNHQISPKSDISIISISQESAVSCLIMSC